MLTTYHHLSLESWLDFFERLWKKLKRAPFFQKILIPMAVLLAVLVYRLDMPWLLVRSVGPFTDHLSRNNKRKGAQKQGTY